MFPSVVRCDELPQWIISSDRAAYHPFANTIYIRNDLGMTTLVHEYCHWLFHKLGFPFGHKLLDWRS